jgi:hypothetical protein
MAGKIGMRIVLSVTALLFLILAALAFNPRILEEFWSNKFIVVLILLLGVAPLIFLPRTLKKRSPPSAIAVLLLSGAIMTGLVYLVGNVILGMDSNWLSFASNLSTWMLIASCLLFIWSAFTSKSRK